VADPDPGDVADRIERARRQPSDLDAQVSGAHAPMVAPVRP